MSEPSKEARDLWEFAWTRVQNLHTDREPPFVTRDQAPRDIQAEWHMQEALDAERAKLVARLEAAEGLAAVLQAFQREMAWVKEQPKTRRIGDYMKAEASAALTAYEAAGRDERGESE